MAPYFFCFIGAAYGGLTIALGAFGAITPLGGIGSSIGRYWLAISLNKVSLHS